MRPANTRKPIWASEALSPSINLIEGWLTWMANRDEVVWSSSYGLHSNDIRGGGSVPEGRVKHLNDDVELASTVHCEAPFRGVMPRSQAGTTLRGSQEAMPLQMLPAFSVPEKRLTQFNFVEHLCKLLPWHVELAIVLGCKPQLCLERSISRIVPCGGVSVGPGSSELALTMRVYDAEQLTRALGSSLAIALRAPRAYLPLLRAHVQDAILMQVQQAVVAALLTLDVFVSRRVDGAREHKSRARVALIGAERMSKGTPEPLDRGHN